MAKYYFQIEKFKITPAKIGFNTQSFPMDKSSKTYTTINEVRAAARKHLINRKLYFRGGFQAAIYKDEKEIDVLALEGGEIESMYYGKRVNDVGKLVPKLKWY